MYDLMMWPFEHAFLSARRRSLAGRARGKVLEVGAGTGVQLRWYRPGVSVVALEPDPAMAARARRRVARAAVPVEVVDGVAGDLPFADQSFDAAVVVLTLCTVPDPVAALAELRRVLVFGGTLLLLEHVHLPWQPGRWLQSRAASRWASVAGGCRLDRDTVRFVKEAGFDVVEDRAYLLGWIHEVVARSG
jgi:ubiquinone/menaquinone biosynthesis C-methylase UbiE